MREENREFESGDLIIDWSKFKGYIVGRNAQRSKNSYIEFRKMLNEVDFELVSGYASATDKVELIYKFDDDVKLNITPTAFKKQTYKAIINFKNILTVNNDEFVKFVGLTDGGNLIAKIKTFDGGVVKIDTSQYNSFNKSRQDFYNKLKEIGGYTSEYYKDNKEKINIYINNIKFNMSPNIFKCSTYKNIINFKNNLIKNGDEFIKFIGLTTGGKLIAKIKTFDGGEINIDIGNYDSWNKGRIDFYNKLKEIGGKAKDYYKGDKNKLNIFIDDVKLNSINSRDLKRCTCKTIINFKSKLKENNDEFIKFIKLSGNGSLIAQIKTFDGGYVDLDIGFYNIWSCARQDFYEKLKEVNGYIEDYYINTNTKVDIYIDDIKLNPMSPIIFKTKTYKSVINFKNKLIKNNDKFIKFIGLNGQGNLISQIKTFDDGVIDIDIGAYNQWNNGRQSTYSYCKEKGYKILSEYTGSKDKILIDFNCGHEPHWTLPNNLKRNHDCPICSESKGEKVIREYLEDNNIEFKQEYRFENCRHKYPLPFDFYIAHYNLCIEFDGVQHYVEKDFFGGEESFKDTQIRDKIKSKFCKDKGINLLRIPYWELDNIDRILDMKFSRLIESLKRAC